MPNAVFAWLELSDGTRFPLEACVRGWIIGINQQVIDDPKLLLSSSERAYLCIIEPRKEYLTMAALGQPFTKKRKEEKE